MTFVQPPEIIEPILGSFATRGGRSLQQDMHLRIPLKPVLLDEAQKLITDAMGSAAETVRSMSQAQQSGTTASMAVITKDSQLVVAQVGDSPVMFFTKSGESGKITCHDNLVSQHMPSNPAERNRVEAEGGELHLVLKFKDRQDHISILYLDPNDEKTQKEKVKNIQDNGGTILGSRLMVSSENYSINITRSIGDHAITGISNKPEMTVINLSDYLKHPQSRVWVVVASDGLTDGIKPKDIGQHLASHQTLATQAEKLAELAIMGGSGDNITTTIAELRPGNSGSAILSVMDGHGKFGDVIANAVHKQLGVAIDRHGLDPSESPTTPFAKIRPQKDTSPGRA